MEKETELLIRIGSNKWTTRKNRWNHHVFHLYDTNEKDGVKIKTLIPRPPFSRSIWDWLFGRFRVPVPVANEMIRDGVIDQFYEVMIPSNYYGVYKPATRIALIKCKKHVYGAYMEYSS